MLSTTSKPVRKVGYDLAGLFCRPVIERLNRIHTEIQRGRYPNCRSLAEELEVSGKTIQRDIDFMRDRLRLPLDYDMFRRGFFYTAPVIRFPVCELKMKTQKATPEELFVIRFVERSVRRFRGTKLQDTLERGIGNLKSRLYGCKA